MSEQEEAFWVWFEQIKPYINSTTLRMAFDAGYEAAEGKK